ALRLTAPRCSFSGTGRRPRPDWGGDQAMDFAQVLSDELTLIGVRRQEVRRLAPQPPGLEEGTNPRQSSPEVEAEGHTPVDRGQPDEHPPEGPERAGAPAQDQDAPEPTEAEKKARLAALDRRLAGLALSGGGIRSATFALGVLQGLADLKILSRFDYLSTVS